MAALVSVDCTTEADPDEPFGQHENPLHRERGCLRGAEISGGGFFNEFAIVVHMQLLGLGNIPLLSVLLFLNTEKRKKRLPSTTIPSGWYETWSFSPSQAFLFCCQAG
jgi:hypothetical protein